MNKTSIKTSAVIAGLCMIVNVIILYFRPQGQTKSYPQMAAYLLICIGMIFGKSLFTLIGGGIFLYLKMPSLITMGSVFIHYSKRYLRSERTSIQFLNMIVFMLLYVVVCIFALLLMLKKTAIISRIWWVPGLLACIYQLVDLYYIHLISGAPILSSVVTKDGFMKVLIVVSLFLWGYSLRRDEDRAGVPLPEQTTSSFFGSEAVSSSTESDTTADDSESGSNVAETYSFHDTTIDENKSPGAVSSGEEEEDRASTPFPEQTASSSSGREVVSLSTESDITTDDSKSSSNVAEGYRYHDPTIDENNSSGAVAGGEDGEDRAGAPLPEQTDSSAFGSESGSSSTESGTTADDSESSSNVAETYTFHDPTIDENNSSGAIAGEEDGEDRTGAPLPEQTDSSASGSESGSSSTESGTTADDSENSSNMAGGYRYHDPTIDENNSSGAVAGGEDTELPLPEIEMRRHKFLIYFLIWIWVLWDIYTAVGDFQAYPLIINNAFVKGRYLVLAQAVLALMLAIYTVKVRFDLAKYRKGAPHELQVMYYITIGVNMITVIFYLINEVPTDTEVISPIIANIICIFAYRRYYNMRDQYFNR